MLDSTTQTILLLVLLPGLAIIGVTLNMIIRARGGRSLLLSLRGFGITLQIETSPKNRSDADKELADEEPVSQSLRP